MRNIINLIYKFKHIGIFISLELLCLKLNHTYRLHNNQFSTNHIEIINKIESKIDEFRNFFHIKNINKNLLEENRLLRTIIAQHEYNIPSPQLDSKSNYALVAAKVINNSIIYSRNYITLDKGSENGIEPGMGVFCNNGIVGKVVLVSKHFATVISILNMDVWFSAEIKNSGTIGSIRWAGDNVSKVKLMYISRHLSPKIGDEVITSGYGDSFYKGIPIGRISFVHINKNEAFYDISVDLSTKMYSLEYVYVIKNNKLAEQLLIESKTRKPYE